MDRKRPTVLVADDHRLIRHTLAGVISRQMDVDVVEARDGNEALAALRAQDVDLALLDISMPGMTGLEVIETIKRENGRVEFVVMSAYDSEFYEEKALRLGAREFIPKEQVTERLLPSIRRLLDNRPHNGNGHATDVSP